MGKRLAWLIGLGVEPHIPANDMSRRKDGTFSGADFACDPNRGLDVCPADKILKTTGRLFAGNTLYNRASKLNCERCPLKLRCGPKAPARRVSRGRYEAARDQAQGRLESEP